MTQRQKITIFVLHHDDASDYEWVLSWLDRWGDQIAVTDYSTGGWEHLWDVEAPQAAVDEVPNDFLCSSQWATPELFTKPTLWQRLNTLLGRWWAGKA